ncbi:hypothetical protein CEXT_399681 [Caerostris extrusa]|uniref:Uncharacterized protein n=1 Tax=Caerostris extrusa TaxID=172846 RepID=A0AAV4Y470_CAEEX|nr:hypothetical protein CEXT_399681 [Caerostris extrusa]
MHDLHDASKFGSDLKGILLWIFIRRSRLGFLFAGESQQDQLLLPSPMTLKTVSMFFNGLPRRCCSPSIRKYIQRIAEIQSNYASCFFLDASMQMLLATDPISNVLKAK